MNSHPPRLADADTSGSPGDPQPNGEPRGDQSTRRVRIRVDASEVKTTYVNAFQTHASGDEVVLELGFNRAVPSPSGGGDEPSAEPLELGHRVILTYPTLKRLAVTASQVVRAYESEHGEIPLNPGETRQPRRR